MKGKKYNYCRQKNKGLEWNALGLY